MSPATDTFVEWFSPAVLLNNPTAVLVSRTFSAVLSMSEGPLASFLPFAGVDYRPGAQYY